jgi:hypothetical protein
MFDKKSPENEEPVNPDRRMLLRTGGVAVVAGVAALAVVETATAGSAQAAAGSPLVLGNSNDSDAVPTSLTSAAASDPTLTVGNTAGMSALRLGEETYPTITSPPLASGDLANYSGDLYYTAGSSVGPLTGFVYSEYTANQLVTIAPQRVLDTRSPAGQGNIINAAGNLDTAGRLLGGHTIEVDLSGLEFAAAAAYCNLTAVSPAHDGFLTLWLGGTQPATSSLNYLAGAVVANFAVTGISATDSVFIYSMATTHVLLDITAFAVGSPYQVNSASLAAAPAAAARKGLASHARTRKPPSWYVAR